jgi:hypothetical protein
MYNKRVLMQKIGTLFAFSRRYAVISKVLVELFQKLAESRDSVSGRRPQTAKFPYHTEELRKPAA